MLWGNYKIVLYGQEPGPPERKPPVKAKSIALAFCLIALVGCAAHQPIAKDRDFRGQSLLKTRVVIPTNIVYNSAIMPAGEYIPLFEDEEGAYFQSPTGVWVSNASFSGGGLYLPFSPGGQIWLWNERGGRPGLSFKFWKLPPEVSSKFEIVLY
jgi:hypothetical protein